MVYDQITHTYLFYNALCATRNIPFGWKVTAYCLLPIAYCLLRTADSTCALA